MTVSQTFLVFDYFSVLKSTGQVFQTMYLKKDLSNVSPIIRLRLWVRERRPAEEECQSLTSHQVNRTDCQQDSPLLLPLTTWLNQYSLGFSTVKVFPHPQFILSSLKGSHYVQPPLKEWEFVLQLLFQTSILAKASHPSQSWCSGSP